MAHGGSGCVSSLTARGWRVVLHVSGQLIAPWLKLNNFWKSRNGVCGGYKSAGNTKTKC